MSKTFQPSNAATCVSQIFCICHWSADRGEISQEHAQWVAGVSPALQMLLLNIAPHCLQSWSGSTQLFLLTCCLSASASGSQGQTTDQRIISCRNGTWGLQNTPICWEMAQPCCLHSSQMPNSPSKPRKQKRWRRILALDPVGGFQSINHPQAFLSRSLELDRDYRT